MPKTVLLGDVVTIQSGKSRPSSSGEYPVYGGNGISNYADDYNISEPTVIVGRVGAYCGSVYIERNNFWLSDNALGLTAREGTDLKYLYYLLKHQDLNKRSVGGAQPLLTQGILNNISVTLPDVGTQKEIAKILGDLDIKIELNRRMNETLEKIGQALFKHYFIDSPDRKNWERQPLSTFGQVVCGKTPPKTNKEFFGGNVPFIKIPDMHGQTFITETQDSLSEKGRDYQDNKIIPPYSLCVSCIATVGLVSITALSSQTNQQIISIVPAKNYSILYLYFQLKILKDELVNRASSGSATPNMNTSTFSKIKISSPNQKTFQGFDDVARPLFQRILTNQNENKNLVLLRDSLLPRLISGKVGI